MAVLVRDIIPQVLEKQRDWRTVLARDWGHLVGSLATRTCLEKIYDDTVVIGVYESHWMQELFLLSSDIKDLLNNALGTSRIRQVRFKLVEERKRAQRVMYPKKTGRPAESPLNASQKQALLRITDDGLRQALADFWARCSAFQ